MITSIEIKKKALRKYPEYLRNVAAGTDFQPIVILCDKKQVTQWLIFTENWKIYVRCRRKLKAMVIRLSGRP